MLQIEDLKVYFRNEFVEFKQANVSIANTAFLYGLGVFGGTRAHYNDQQDQLFIFRPQDHFARLSNSCKLCYFKNFNKDYTADKFTSVVKKLLKVNEIRQDVYIRTTIFVDETEIAPKFKDYSDSLAIFLYPLGDYVPTTGMKCTVSSWRRIEDNAIPARGKMVGAYINTALTKTEALENGYNEAIVLDNNNHAVEGSAENLFMVRNDKVVTPPLHDNILEGITRKTTIQILEDEGHDVLERSIDRTELYFADEVFFTGTGAQIAPVTEIDKRTIGDGKVGEIAKKVQETYRNAVRGKIKKYQDWVVPVY